MRNCHAALVGLLVSAIAAPLSAADEAKPVDAKVLLVGVVTQVRLAQIEDQHTKQKVRTAMLALGEKSIVTILFPTTDDFAPKTILGLGGEVVAIEGVLALSKEQGFHLRPTRATIVDDKNKASFPARGKTRVEGSVTTGKFEYAKGKTSKFVVSNASNPIVLTGGVLDDSHTEGRFSFMGQLELSGGGRIVLNVEKAEKIGK